MPFGPDVLTIVSYSDAPTPGDLGTYEQVPSLFSVPGCHHRPLTFTETAELQFDVATEIWKTTIPIGEYSASVRNQVLAVQPNDDIQVDGVRYSVIGGVRPHKDFSGWFKATIFSKRHIG